MSDTNLIIMFCVFSGIAVWYMHNDKKKHLDEKDYKYGDLIVTKLLKKIDNINDIKRDLHNDLRIRDRKALYDDLSPPERRMPEHEYPTRELRRRINISTHGDIDDYQLLGVAVRNGTETAYNLFGRQTFPRSNQYEYYVTGNMSNNNPIKIPIKGNKELSDGDKIDIIGTDPSKGDFIVKLYNYDTPRYNPNVI